MLWHTLSMIASAPHPSNSEMELHADSDPHVQQLRATIKTMIGWLPPAEREQFLREISATLRPATNPKAGDVLATIVQLLPKQKTWTVAELKQRIDDRGVAATPKEVYNAVGYLARRGRITRVGYGRYLADGMEVVTSDDLGGASARHEDEYRTNRD
jgi:hypothetical protein